MSVVGAVRKYPRFVSSTDDDIRRVSASFFTNSRDRKHKPTCQDTVVNARLVAVSAMDDSSYMASDSDRDWTINVHYNYGFLKFRMICIKIKACMWLICAFKVDWVYVRHIDTIWNQYARSILLPSVGSGANIYASHMSMPYGNRIVRHMGCIWGAYGIVAGEALELGPY